MIDKSIKSFLTLSFYFVFSTATFVLIESNFINVVDSIVFLSAAVVIYISLVSSPYEIALGETFGAKSKSEISRLFIALLMMIVFFTQTLFVLSNIATSSIKDEVVKVGRESFTYNNLIFTNPDYAFTNEAVFAGSRMGDYISDIFFTNRMTKNDEVGNESFRLSAIALNRLNIIEQLDDKTIWNIDGSKLGFRDRAGLNFSKEAYFSFVDFKVDSELMNMLVDENYDGFVDKYLDFNIKEKVRELRLKPKMYQSNLSYQARESMELIITSELVDLNDHKENLEKVENSKLIEIIKFRHSKVKENVDFVIDESMIKIAKALNLSI